DKGVGVESRGEAKSVRRGTHICVMLNGDEVCELDIDGCNEEMEGVTIDGTKLS
ncbi:hypothetical protein A2U01_0078014, partial [Trifolium medium]|nr:hypothetical protein [Trifolium medium]